MGELDGEMDIVVRWHGKAFDEEREEWEGKNKGRGKRGKEGPL